MNGARTLLVLAALLAPLCTFAAGEALESGLREAQAAHAQAQRGGLGDGKAPCAANARQRCEALRGGDRGDCLARMAGHGTVRGSVESGGILRELTTYNAGLAPANQAATPASAPR